MSATKVLEEFRVPSKAVVLEKKPEDYRPFRVTVQTRRSFSTEDAARTYYKNQVRRKVKDGED